MIELTSLGDNFSTLNFQLSSGVEDISRTVQQLSSGVRMVQAKDDVAGLSISTSLLKRTTTIRATLTNLSQADSLLQVKDSAAERVQEMLFRMSALATQANSGSLTNTDRGFLQIEMNQLREEIDRILKETNFNGVKLFEAAALPPVDDGVQAISSLADIQDITESGTQAIRVGEHVFDGYVETYDNASTGEQEQWLLIGRGREGWNFNQEGQGRREDVATDLGSMDAFDPKAYDAAAINSLLREAGVTMDQIEFRVKRAENNQGTLYQEGRFRPDFQQTQFNWNMYSNTDNQGEWEIIDSSLGANFYDDVSNWRDTGDMPNLPQSE